MNNDNIIANNIIYNDIIQINNNIINNEEIIDENMNIPNNDQLPVIYENDQVLTFDDLLNQLDNFINRESINRYIMTHIDYIMYINSNDDAMYNDNYVNNILNSYNIANQHEYLNDERELIDKFKDIVNQSNLDQKKMMYNTFSNLHY
jgi:hypothetical protein